MSEGFAFFLVVVMAFFVGMMVQYKTHECKMTPQHYDACTLVCSNNEGVRYMIADSDELLECICNNDASFPLRKKWKKEK